MEEEEEFLDIPTGSVFYTYAKYFCITPDYGTYIPFITTRDVLTSGDARSMITGTKTKQIIYEN